MNILKSILNWVTGAAKKVKEALAFGKDFANEVKKYADSPIFDAIVKATPTKYDDAALNVVRGALNAFIVIMGWADKKVSDFTDATLPHVLNAVSAESAKLYAEYTKADLSRQQAIASAQVVYDEKVVG